MLTLLTMLMAFAGGEGSHDRLAEVNAGVQRVYDAIIMADGTVDYATLNREPSLQKDLEAYVAFMAEISPDEIASETNRIAILANAYNVFTLVGVNRHWPTRSVRDIRPFFGFFTKDEWVVGGKKISLNDLENKHLRPLDTRVHFIINCASASCPKIPATVLTRDNLEAIMERSTRDFLLDESRNRFDRASGVWHLSKIFDWFQKDWGKKEDVVAFIRGYRKDLEAPKKVKYLDYDWALNGPTGK